METLIKAQGSNSIWSAHYLKQENSIDTTCYSIQFGSRGGNPMTLETALKLARKFLANDKSLLALYCVRHGSPALNGW